MRSTDGFAVCAPLIGKRGTNMKFMPGYQIREDNLFVDEIIAQREHIHEVYFAWGDIPNGRNNQILGSVMLPWEAQRKQIEDLTRLSKAGISLNLLLNGNCYGGESQSRAFFEKIGETVDYIERTFGLASVTAASPLIAKFLKNNFENLEIRASVNMKIGTPEGMDYLSDYFDGYYMQRELNRDIEHIKVLKKWADENGKRLYLLANSGCLNNCSAQTFHDNLVSHETELKKYDNAYEFHGICHEYLSKEENYGALITNTNFIRPEDIHLYDGYFTAAKLATRVSRNPVNILRSYINARYSGNILDILEPAHSIYPYVLENGDPLRIVKINTDAGIFENSMNKTNI